MKDIKLTNNFTLSEMCHTNSGITNEPNLIQVSKLLSLCTKLLQPVRELFNSDMHINSGFRCEAVNTHEGGAITSQHLKGEAADINTYDNAKLFHLIKDNFEFDQLIWEKGTPKQPAWVHVSYSETHNRKQVLIYKDGKYIPYV